MQTRSNTKGFAISEPSGGKAQTHVWLTPKSVIDALGPFDLDPCAAPEPRPWETATTSYVEAQDGLSLPWFGFIWLNPPYGRHVSEWVRRMADHNNGIALIFARTGAGWFQEYAPKATGIFFLKKRLVFCKADGTPANSNAGAASCFLAYGEEAVARIAAADFPGIWCKTTRPSVPFLQAG
jgi:hypothetical protein